MKKLTELVGKILEIDAKALDRNSSAENVSTWDSVNNLIIISEIEREYGATITVNEVYKLKDLGDLFNLLVKKGKKISF